jgi:deaminated glutathione amidase
MWENYFYLGGDDNGLIDVDGFTVGAAMCWELMRTQTVHRLRGHVDLAMTGSGWWSILEYHPRPVFGRLEAANHATAWRAAATFATFVGAPVLHAGTVGDLGCRTP